MIKNSGHNNGNSSGFMIPQHIGPLADTVTGIIYNLIIENGRLMIQEVQYNPPTGEDVKTTLGPLFDNNTGVGYVLVIDNGKLAIQATA